MASPPWQTLTNPEEIARAVSQMNIAQYHRAHNTPFGSGLIGQAIGCRANTPVAAELLAGNSPILPNIFPETQRIIDLLGTSTLSPLSMDTIITEEEFITGYKVVRR
jgi:hypothetical protein